MTHLRRAGTGVGDTVLFTEYTPFKSKMELFLAYSENKQNVINMLKLKIIRIGMFNITCLR